MRLYSLVENRVFGLDLMRAIAVLVVIFGHSRYLLRGINRVSVDSLSFRSLRIRVERSATMRRPPG